MIDTYVSSFERKRAQAHINKVLHQVHNEINNYNPIVTTQDYAEFHFRGTLKPGDVLTMPRPLKSMKVTGYANGIPLVVGTLDTTGALVVDSNITIFNVPKTYTTTTTAFVVGNSEHRYNAFIRYDNTNPVYNFDSWDEYATRFNQVYRLFNSYSSKFNIVTSKSGSTITGYLHDDISISNTDCTFNRLNIKDTVNVDVTKIDTSSKEGIKEVLRNYTDASYYKFNNGSKMAFGYEYNVNNTLFSYTNGNNFIPISAMIARGSEVGLIPTVCDILGINAVQFYILFNPIVDGEHVCNSLGMIADYGTSMVYQIASRYNAGNYSQKLANGMIRKWEISIVRKTDVVKDLFAFGGSTWNNNINLLPNNGYVNANTREAIGNAFDKYGAKRYRVTWNTATLNNSRYIPPAPEDYSHNVVYNGADFMDVKRLSHKVLIEFNEASDATTLPLRLGYCPYQQYWKWNQNYYDEPSYITKEEYETGLYKICFPGYNLNYVKDSPKPPAQECGSFVWYKNTSVKNYTIVNKITETKDEGIENLAISIDIKYRRG